MTQPSTHDNLPTGAARRRGLLAVGDQVQLTDPKGKHHTFTLTPGKDFHTHRGSFSHDALIGQPEGTVVTTTNGAAYLALRPLLSEFGLMHRRVLLDRRFHCLGVRRRRLALEGAPRGAVVWVAHLGTTPGTRRSC